MTRLAKADSAERLAIAVSQRSVLGADEDYVRAKMALRVAEIRGLLGPETILLKETPLLLISPQAEQKLMARALEALGDFHRQTPLLPGISKEQLRSRYFARIPQDVFTGMLDRALRQKKIHIEKDTISVAGRRISLSEQEGTLASRVRELVEESGLEFPGVEKLARRLPETPAAVKSILYVLLREGRLVKIRDDYFLPTDRWDSLKTRIRAMKATRRTFSVPDFKTFFGVTRKYAIPLLEQLDREGVTRRSGNERIIL